MIKKKPHSADIVEGKRPKRYGFVATFIGAILRVKLTTSSSFRGIHEIFNILGEQAGLPISPPTHTTILNWVHKLGLYQLSKPKKKAKDWVIILDHSVQVGKEKLLVVFGVRESEIDFTKPIQFQHLQPIWEEARDHWDGESIKQVLAKIQKMLGRVKYAVADRGTDIKCGLKLAGIQHVNDVTHRISNILKKLYQNDKRFTDFLKEMVQSRNSAHQSGLAHLMPPSLRTKARYENIGVISTWAKKIIKYLSEVSQGKDKNLREKAENQYGWVLKHKELIKELTDIDDALRKFQKALKTQGMRKNKRQTTPLRKLKSKNGKIIKNYLINYVESTTKMIRNRLTPIMCSSDIIESAFGKYKNYASANPMAGITSLVLCIAAFTSSLEEQDILECLEKYRINDVKEWAKKNVGESLFQKRKLCLTPI